MARSKAKYLGLTYWVIYCIAVHFLGETHEVKFNHTIRVSNQGNDSEECWRNERFACKSIEFAMKKKQLNYTRIFLEYGIHNLSTVLSAQFLGYFYIEGNVSAGNTPSISCNASNAGITFKYCHQISLMSIKLENCGTEVQSTNVDRRNSTRRAWNVSTALLIEETSNVTLLNVTINGSFGYGTVFYDVIGNVLITGTTFSSNRKRNFTCQPGYASGGGIYIELRPSYETDNNFENSGSNYTFINCQFIKNVAEERKSIPSLSNYKQFISFGRGGGLSFFSRGNARNNNLTIIDCQFESNDALWGAGIFAEFDDKTGSNMIIIRQSHFLNNSAKLGGGGIRVGINSDRTNGPNIVFIKDSTFANNSALVGGGFAQYRIEGNGKFEEKLTIDNCTFSYNAADRGAAVNLILMRVDILNATVESHVHAFNTSLYQGEGAFYIYSSSLTFNGQNYFGSNYMTAIVFETSTMKNTGHLIFHNNTGMNGGGVALYGDSTLLMVPKSTLRFENNTALKRGGAFYVEKPVSSQLPMQSTELKMRSCFFLFGNDFGDTSDPDKSDTMTYFVGNSAPDSFGSNIYADTISDCRRPSEPLYNNSALKWKVFNYIGSKYKDGRTTVVTNPAIIAHVNKEEWSAYPGLPFSPTVVLLDENYNSVFGNIRINVTAKYNGQVLIHGLQLFYVKDKLSYIRFDGLPLQKYSVLIETTNGPPLSKLLRDLELKRCPLGYYREMEMKRCVCLSQKFSMHLGVTKCDTASTVYILNGRWGDPLITNKSTYENFAVNICPDNYCNTSYNIRRIDHIFYSNKQCAIGRDKNSPLCGKCESDKSVSFGSEICIKCNDNFGVFWLLLFFVVLTLIIFIIILLNIDTYATSLNAFLYSYQIIALCTHGNTTLDIFIKIITSLSTLSGIGGMANGVCLWEHMNDLQKIFLNYIIPTYFIVCILVIARLSYCFSNQCFLNRSHTIFRSFVFISVIAYSDFTRITFELLHAVKVREKWVVYKAGFAEFFKGEHIPYSIIAILIAIFIVILFPILLMFSHLVITIPRFDRLRGVFDFFNEPFRRLELFDIFCTFYFLTRLALLTVFIFMSQGTLKDTIFAIVSVAILLIFVYTKPYTTESMNIYDTILLMNLTVLAVINLGLNGLTEDRIPLQQVAHVLTYLPLACGIVKLALWCREKYQRRNHNADAGRE